MIAAYLISHQENTMSRARKLLDKIATPKTLKEMSDRLDVISDAMGNDNGIKDIYDADHTALIDFWTYVEMAQGESSQGTGDDYPATDPLTMISAVQRYNVVTGEQAVSLKKDFMASANAAAGKELTPAQVRKLFQLFRHYDPVSKLKLEP